MKISLDSLTSFVSGLGVQKHDKRSTTHYRQTFLTLQELRAAYKSSWIAEKIVDLPVEDALRVARLWQALPDQVTLIQAEEARLGLYRKIMRAAKIARRDGFGAIYIAVGDNDVTTPLDPNRVAKGGIHNLAVLTDKECTANELETDVESPLYGQPSSYAIGTGKSNRTNVHPSRLILFHGREQLDPFEVSAGQGTSALEAPFQAIKDADATIANVASLVFEASVDVFKVEGLLDRIGDKDFEERLLQRFNLANVAKSVNRALIMDKSEEYDKKSTSFSSLPEIIREMLQIVSGAANIPLTRFLGTSPTGLSSTGEGDMNVYFDRIQAMRELDFRPALAVLDECVIRSALGDRPAEIFYTWPPLKQLDDKDRATVAKTIAEVAKNLVADGVFTPDELRAAVMNELANIGFFGGLETEVSEDDDLDLSIGDAAPKTLYVKRSVLNAAEIIRWAETQGITGLLKPDDLHVTIAFSRAEVDWFKVGEAWESEITIGAGGARQMEMFGGDALVLLFKSSELEWRHRHFNRAGASWDWPEYQPHITLSYKAGAVDLSEIEPYQGKIVLGHEVFQEVDEDWKSKVVSE